MVAPAAVAEWAQSVMDLAVAGSGAAAEPGADAGVEEVAAARARLESLEVDPVADHAPFGGPGRLVLADGAIRSLLACEGMAAAAATAPPTEVDWPMFRGRALDAFVAHVVFAGAVGDPVADLASAFEAADASEDLALLQRYATEPGVADDLAELAAGALAFRGLQRWDPRVEVSVGSRLRGGLELRGRADLVLGGAGTIHPCAVLEVKSGHLRDAHRAQLRHYVLLTALRHGALPAGAALWSPLDGLEPLHVPGGLASAAERVVAGASRVASMLDRGRPALFPGLHCRLCPARGGCPAAAQFDDPGDRAGDDGDG